MKHFLLFGTHPELSLAEARAVLGKTVEPWMGSMGLVESPTFDGASMQERLAGVVKLGEVVSELETTDVSALAAQIADQIEARPRADRVLFGLTLAGTPKDKDNFKKLPIELKRALQGRGRGVRWVTGDNGNISPAAISKLSLTTEGYDFVIAIDKKKIAICLTTNVQNPDAWSERDFGRPFRDAKTGMLPPKLARMMVNLSSVNTGVLLDPFCGGGTVLMEAAMLFPQMKLIGSDIDGKQVSGTQRNFEWLKAKNIVDQKVEPKLLTFPAQSLKGQIADASVDVIVTEGYLGKPLQETETELALTTNKREVEAVWNQTLPVLGKLLKDGGRLVCVWPAFVSGRGLVNTGADAVAQQAGLKRIIGPIAYGRPDQRLVRNLFVYEKKA
jgi:tRNA G10  N-methylase Trm11